MKKLLYLTVTAPLGSREAFLIPEMNSLVQQGADLTVVPVRPAPAPFHQDGAALLPRCVSTNLASRRVLLAALAWLGKTPLRILVLLWLLLSRGSLLNRLKNLAVFPKGLFIAALVKSLEIGHIHAHWASTPSTCALVASALTGVPWSFTVHRWDISNNNLIKEKVQACSFVRVISSWGRERLLAICGAKAAGKILHCPMGVELPAVSSQRPAGQGRIPLIISVGGLTPVKGHLYLLQACRLLAEEGLDFRCLIIGDGPERDRLTRLARQLGLKRRVIFAGALPHHRVLRLFGSGLVSLLAHPSVETPEGEHEGVPVAVMEAMACGVPVIVTESGSTGDLVDEECGLLVPPGDSEALARGIAVLLGDAARSASLAGAARKKIEAGFAQPKNASVLLARMKLEP